MAPQKFSVAPYTPIPVRSVVEAAPIGSLTSSNCDEVFLPGQPSAPVHPTTRPEDPQIEAVAAALGLEPPEHFICPITLAVMRQPMSDCHGHTFDALGIARWLSHTRRCPINRKPLWPETLHPNLILAAEIAEWSRHVEALADDQTESSISLRGAKRPGSPLAAARPTDAADPHPRLPKPREFLSLSSSRLDHPRPWWSFLLLCGAPKETCGP